MQKKNAKNLKKNHDEETVISPYKQLLTIAWSSYLGNNLTLIVTPPQILGRIDYI